jgi:hypothetical protein
MTPRRQRRTGTVSELRRRETQARAVQAATGPSAEIERLQAHVDALLCELRARDFTIAALRREIIDTEDEHDD